MTDGIQASTHPAASGETPDLTRRWLVGGMAAASVLAPAAARAARLRAMGRHHTIWD